jgi:hypothetical protein
MLSILTLICCTVAIAITSAINSANMSQNSKAAAPKKNKMIAKRNGTAVAPTLTPIEHTNAVCPRIIKQASGDAFDLYLEKKTDFFTKNREIYTLLIDNKNNIVSQGDILLPSQIDYSKPLVTLAISNLHTYPTASSYTFVFSQLTDDKTKSQGGMQEGIAYEEYLIRVSYGCAKYYAQH